MTATFLPKVILITGASSSTGAATAHRLAGEGHYVILGDRRTERLVTIVGAIRSAGGTADCFAVDVACPDSMRDFAAFAEDIHGRFDAIVNYAGVMPLSLLNALPVDLAVSISGPVAQPADVDVSEVIVRQTASAC